MMPVIIELKLDEIENQLRIHIKNLNNLEDCIRKACNLLDLAYDRGGLNADGVMALGILRRTLEGR